MLKDVSTVAYAGQMTAVMGASGAGKTSLLNVMSGSVQVNAGSVALNGKKLELADFKALCCFIPQDDTLLDSLTAKEVFDYTARLRMPAGTTTAEG